jgi:hypothetical protein
MLYEFMHAEPWDELHIIHEGTQTVVAIYSRVQFIALVVRLKSGKLPTKRVRHGECKAVAVVPIQ